MSCGQTSQHIARLFSLLARGLITLAVICGLFEPISSATDRSLASVESGRKAAQGEDVAMLLREAAALLQAGKPDEAEPLLRRALKSAPNNADAHNLLGAVLDQRGHARAAEREFLEALRLNPGATSAR